MSTAPGLLAISCVGYQKLVLQPDKDGEGLVAISAKGGSPSTFLA